MTIVLIITIILFAYAISSLVFSPIFLLNFNIDVSINELVSRSILRKIANRIDSLWLLINISIENEYKVIKKETKEIIHIIKPVVELYKDLATLEENDRNDSYSLGFLFFIVLKDKKNKIIYEMKIIYKITRPRSIFFMFKFKQISRYSIVHNNINNIKN